MRIAALVISFLCAGVACSQIPQRYIMFQLKVNQDVKVVKERFGLETGTLEILDKEFRIFTYRSERPEELQRLLNDPGFRGVCDHYQWVNPVKSRSVVPDDPLLGLQKYLLKNRAPDLWHDSLDGVTAKGDTLVIAIIDSGHDTLHPDLWANRYVNYHEVWGNKIDDDLNGYVDDRYGWNGGDDSNTVFTKVSLDAHGTGIAGVIGAVGNNSIGISGINWKVKILPVVCYPSKGFADDAGIVRSLIYVYRMKKRWLETGGDTGAYIVSVNTSIGIDFATPADAPIWCAMYDSLGKVGIVASCATTNNETDIGLNGDIPGTCPSAYTIVTTSTDFNDNRVSSGFSNIWVDLAAQGDKVYTTTLVKNAGSNGPYAEFSGTSFAAPQVSGLVGLLYQYACDSFLGMAIQEPDRAALLIKTWILKGTDKIPSMAGKAVTGGRLNSTGALRQLQQWCNPPRPDTPQKYEVVIWPVPVQAGERLTISYADSVTELQATIIAMDGKVVISEKILNSDHIVLKPNDTAPGMYVLHLVADGRRLVRKLLIY